MQKGLVAIGAIAVAAVVALVGASVLWGGDDDAATSATTTTIWHADDLEADPDEFQFGQESTIVDGSTTPEFLEANVDQDLLITNDTDAAVTVRITNGPTGADGTLEEATIEAGDSLTFRSTYSRSIFYEVDGDPEWTGQIRVDSQITTDPEEIPLPGEPTTTTVGA